MSVLLTKKVLVLFNSSGQLQHVFKDNRAPGKIHCFQLSNNLLFTGSADSTIAVWDAKQGDFIQLLAGHADSIESLRVIENYLVSASRDGVIKIWDVTTWECLHTLDGYQDQFETYGIKKFLFTQIKALHFANGCLFAGSGDGTVRVWDFNALPVSRYPVRQLESNLALLEQMGALAKEQKYEELAGLLEQAEKELHPDFQKYIEINTNGLKSIQAYTNEERCKMAIEQLKAVVCIELLLHAVTSQNKRRIHDLLIQLHSFDPSFIEGFRKLLMKECGQPKWNDHMSEAFFNCEAYIEEKIRVIVRLRRRFELF